MTKMAEYGDPELTSFQSTSKLQQFTKQLSMRMT